MIAQARQGNISFSELVEKAMTMDELRERLDFEIPGNWNIHTSIGRVEQRRATNGARTGADSFALYEARVWRAEHDTWETTPHKFAAYTVSNLYKLVCENFIVPRFGSRPVAVMR